MKAHSPMEHRVASTTRATNAPQLPNAGDTISVPPLGLVRPEFAFDLWRGWGRVLKNDAALAMVLRTTTVLAGAVTLAVLVFLFGQAAPLLREAGPAAFFTDADWAPTAGRYNIVPMLVGTFWAVLGSVLVATPLGLAVAVFIRIYAPRGLATVTRSVVWLLAGIPSVVFGFWALTRVVPLIGAHRPPGVSLLAGILVLSLMTFPTTALLSEAALSAVPDSLWAGAQALGLGRWATLRYVALPAAGAGILTGIILQVGRALGETMAVIMVMGNTVRFPRTVFDSARTLTSNIALEMSYAMGSHQRALFVSGVVLLIMTTALSLASAIISRRAQ